MKDFLSSEESRLKGTAISLTNVYVLSSFPLEALNEGEVNVG